MQRTPPRLTPACLTLPACLPSAENELRSSGVPFAIVRPVALTEEPGGMPLQLDQGDTIRGKVSREASAGAAPALAGWLASWAASCTGWLAPAASLTSGGWLPSL